VTTPTRRRGRVERPVRLATGLVVAAIALATGGVWWVLAALAFAPILVGSCATCAVSADSEACGDDGALRVASGADTPTIGTPT